MDLDGHIQSHRQILGSYLACEIMFSEYQDVQFHAEEVSSYVKLYRK